MAAVLKGQEMIMYKILVPLDGSELAENALPTAFSLARQRQGEIILLRVPILAPMFVTTPTPEGYGIIWPEQALEHSRGEATQYLATLQKTKCPMDVTVHTQVMAGDIASVIVDTAVEQEVNLILMSAHGYSGVTRWRLGSTAEKVLRSAPCPVLVVRSAQPLHRILIPLDGSPLSEAALPLGLEIAAVLGGEVTLLSATPLSLEQLAALEKLENGLGSRALAEALAEAQNYLERLALAEQQWGVHVQVAARAGPPAEAILKYAETHKVDLIVMASHGHTGLQRWAYGSVTEKVLRCGQASLLIVRPSTCPLTRDLAQWNAQHFLAPSISLKSSLDVDLDLRPTRVETETLNEPVRASEVEMDTEEVWANLEKIYLETYLREKGYTFHSLQQLPKAEAKRLMTEASAYASTRLAEVETRSHLVQELEETVLSQ